MVFEYTPEERRKEMLRRGSPIFNLKNSALSAGSQDIASFEGIPKANKYMPFNFLQITNNSEDEITIYFDGDTTQSKLILKGTIITFENIWFRNVTYKNTGSSSISVNKIEFVAQLLPVSEEYSKIEGIPVIQKIRLMFGL